MRIYDKNAYRDMTAEEAAAAIEFEKEHFPGEETWTDADKAEAYDILMGVSE